MQNFSKLKIGIGLIYVSIVSLVVFLFFYYGANSFLDLDFLKNHKDQIYLFRDQNYVLLSVIYFFFSILWVFLLGFGTPLVIVAGFAFGTVPGALFYLLWLLRLEHHFFIYSPIIILRMWCISI
jgi:hypothetical protein